MDFTLRCNSLKCRKQLTERAVVTTCSHVFCDQCSDALGLTAAAGGRRICPACQTVLTQPDDAVSTFLQPTEDYKTSVLSGLSPSTIMECAGRGLAFWSYQSTQEIVYQEYLAKTLTDKYSTLNAQMEKVLNDANSELNILNQRINNMQLDQDNLKQENTQLATALREKTRKHQQTQELYDRLKRRDMTAATQSAAFESADEVIGNVSSQQRFNNPQQHPTGLRSQAQRDLQALQVDHNGIEKVHTHQRSGSSIDSHGNGGMMAPPLHPRAGGLQNNGFGYGNSMPTPSNHRTQLGPMTSNSSRLGAGGFRNTASTANRGLQNQTPAHQQPFASLTTNTLSRSSMSGYGLSAGLKVGKQSSPVRSQLSQGRHHLSQPGQFQGDGGAYY